MRISSKTSITPLVSPPLRTARRRYSLSVNKLLGAGLHQTYTSARRNQAQLDMSVPESLWHPSASGRYVTDPESLVNAVHLEDGPSGRIQVVIIGKGAKVILATSETSKYKGKRR